METYLLDRFPGRSTAIAAVNRLQSLLSFATHEDYLLIADDVKDPLDSEASLDDLESLLSGMETKPTVPLPNQ